MIKGLDCFVAYSGEEATRNIVDQLKADALVRKIYVVTSGEETCELSDCNVYHTDGRLTSESLRKVAMLSTASHILLCRFSGGIEFGYGCLKRMYDVANNVDAAIVYSDRYVQNEDALVKHPTQDCYFGSVRDDFDFGPLMLMQSSALKEFAEESKERSYKSSALYDFHLYCLRRHSRASLFHISEYLYTEKSLDLRKSGEKQFDYVNPRNRDVQIEREQVCTEHLKTIGAWIDPSSIVDANLDKEAFANEASVIIPVRNRVRTIEDAVRSALSQEASFKFNVIVVDNHSTDGTTDVLSKLAAADERVVHIVPAREDLGIGGCWSLAFNDERCGRFAVQLDSDDLYSGKDTLQRIVDKFYAERCGMVIGSYRMCNFQLETLPPGIIDHREWTDDNGRNNALRINGLGAPRAFFTPLIREIGMPNTSYGEDYAVGLAFSRQYKIGRIYDELYLCRRWEGNSDAALSAEAVNRNNIYKDSLRTMEIINRCRMNKVAKQKFTSAEASKMLSKQLMLWQEARERYANLSSVVTKDFVVKENTISVQFNPSRIVSTGAKIDKATLDKRPCFLCDENRPAEQFDNPMLADYHILVNPFPILPEHFTIPLRKHSPQQIMGHYEDMMKMTAMLDKHIVFYNGPKCGASAPDHMHFQAGSRGIVPVQNDWLNFLYDSVSICGGTWNSGTPSISYLPAYTCPAFAIIASTPQESDALFRKLYSALPLNAGDTEPMMNIISWQVEKLDGTALLFSVVIPRKKHRPDCYFAEGEAQMLVSPGALDMGGLIITPREEDFKKMNAEKAASILQECALSPEEAEAVIKKIKDND